MAESLKQFLGKEAVPIFGWTQGVPVEEQAILPFIHKHVAVMPDVHLGKGATIGSVIPTKGAIVPAAESTLMMASVLRTDASRA